jgi:hypothetical protein
MDIGMDYLITFAGRASSITGKNASDWVKISTMSKFPANLEGTEMGQ